MNNDIRLTLLAKSAEEKILERDNAAILSAANAAKQQCSKYLTEILQQSDLFDEQHR